MPRFNVTLQRHAWMEAKIEIEAANVSEAENKALFIASGDDDEEIDTKTLDWQCTEINENTTEVTDVEERK